MHVDEYRSAWPEYIPCRHEHVCEIRETRLCDTSAIATRWCDDCGTRLPDEPEPSGASPVPPPCRAWVVGDHSRCWPQPCPMEPPPPARVPRLGRREPGQASGVTSEAAGPSAGRTAPWTSRPAARVAWLQNLIAHHRAEAARLEAELLIITRQETDDE